MPKPVVSEPPKFFVYIVESPSAPDIYHGRSEGALVARAVSLDLIPAITRTVINREALEVALRIGLPDAMNQLPEHFPIVHLSAHGGMNGIQLSSGEELYWHDLRKLVVPINLSLNGYLLLCMSACEGYNACQMAMQKDDGPHPFYSMVGHYGKPTWADTAVAYSAFYHLLSKGFRVADCVHAMRTATADAKWLFTTAEESKRGYLEYLRTLEAGDVQEQLEDAAEQSPISDAAKALERPTS